MHWFLKQIENSFLEMKSVRSLSVCAMLTAMCVMLGMFHLPLGNSIQLSFGYLAMGLLGAWYGPVMAALCGGISDLLSFLLFPSGVFFPGFTLSAMLGGFLYGLVLYRKSIRFCRVLVAFALVGILINFILNTFWVALLYGYGIWALLPVRAFKNLVTIPLNAFLFYLIAKPLTHYFWSNSSHL